MCSNMSSERCKPSMFVALLTGSRFAKGLSRSSSTSSSSSCPLFVASGTEVSAFQLFGRRDLRSRICGPSTGWLSRASGSGAYLPASKIPPVDLRTKFSPCKFTPVGLCNADKNQMQVVLAPKFLNINRQTISAPTVSYKMLWSNS